MPHGSHWQRWTPEEDAILDSQYARIGATALVPLLPRRTLQSIRERAYLRGLRAGAAGVIPAPPADDFGILVRGYRERRGWSQGELSRRIGRKISLVNHWERGKIRPSIDSLAALVCALDVHGQAVEALLLAAAAMGNERKEAKSA